MKLRIAKRIYMGTSCGNGRYPCHTLHQIQRSAWVFERAARRGTSRLASERHIELISGLRRACFLTED